MRNTSWSYISILSPKLPGNIGWENVEEPVSPISYKSESEMDEIQEYWFLDCLTDFQEICVC